MYTSCMNKNELKAYIIGELSTKVTYLKRFKDDTLLEALSLTDVESNFDETLEDIDHQVWIFSIENPII